MVACTATDHVGNASSGSFHVTVLGAKEQLSRLVKKVIDASKLPPATKTQLVAKLQALVASFDPNKPAQRQAVCSALKGRAVIRGADGERVVGLDDFHIGPYMTAVGDGEMLTEVRLPLRPGAGSAHEKVERRAGDWAVAAASAALWIENGTIQDAGVALSAVGPTTVHVSRAEELLRGKAPSDELFAQAGEISSEDCAPLPDGRGPVDYKRHLAGVLTKRALRRAAARAQHQEA